MTTDLPSFTRYVQQLAPPWAQPRKAGALFFGAVIADGADAVTEGAQQVSTLLAIRDDIPDDALGAAARARGFVAVNRGVDPNADAYAPIHAENVQRARDAFDRWGEVYFGGDLLAAFEYRSGWYGWIARALRSGGTPKVFASSAYTRAVVDAQAVTTTLPGGGNEYWSDYRFVIDGATDLSTAASETLCSDTTYCLDETFCGFSWSSLSARLQVESLIETSHDHMPAHYRMTAVILSASQGFGDDVTINNALNATASGGTYIGSEGVGWRLI